MTLKSITWWIKIISVANLPFLEAHVSVAADSLLTGSFFSLGAAENSFQNFPISSPLLRQLYPVDFALCRGLF